MPEASLVRRVRTADFDQVGLIAAAFGFDEPDSAIESSYIEFLDGVGRFLVVELDGHIVAFGGSIDTDIVGTRMVTDLFVADHCQGLGLGRSLLAELIDGAVRKMTFSSAHVRAVPTYRRFEMEPRWALRYLRGPSLRERSAVTATVVRDGAWPGARRDLVERWRARGARVLRLTLGGDQVGSAVVCPEGDGWRLQRMITSADHGDSVLAVMRSLDAGTSLLVCTPEWSGVGPVLEAAGFEHLDRDVHCATHDDLISSDCAVVHPGFG